MTILKGFLLLSLPKTKHLKVTSLDLLLIQLVFQTGLKFYLILVIFIPENAAKIIWELHLSQKNVEISNHIKTSKFYQKQTSQSFTCRWYYPCILLVINPESQQFKKNNAGGIIPHYWESKLDQTPKKFPEQFMREKIFMIDQIQSLILLIFPITFDISSNFSQETVANHSDWVFFTSVTTMIQIRSSRCLLCLTIHLHPSSRTPQYSELIEEDVCQLLLFSENLPNWWVDIPYRWFYYDLS